MVDPTTTCHLAVFQNVCTYFPNPNGRKLKITVGINNNNNIPTQHAEKNRDCTHFDVLLHFANDCCLDIRFVPRRRDCNGYTWYMRSVMPAKRIGKTQSDECRMVLKGNYSNRENLGSISVQLVCFVLRLSERTSNWAAKSLVKSATYIELN